MKHVHFSVGRTPSPGITPCIHSISACQSKEPSPKPKKKPSRQAAGNSEPMHIHLEESNSRNHNETTTTTSASSCSMSKSSCHHPAGADDSFENTTAQMVFALPVIHSTVHDALQSPPLDGAYGKKGEEMKTRKLLDQDLRKSSRTPHETSLLAPVAGYVPRGRLLRPLKKPFLTSTSQELSMTTLHRFESVLAYVKRELAALKEEPECISSQRSADSPTTENTALDQNTVLIDPLKRKTCILDCIAEVQVCCEGFKLLEDVEPRLRELMAIARGCVQRCLHEIQQVDTFQMFGIRDAVHDSFERDFRTKENELERIHQDTLKHLELEREEVARAQRQVDERAAELQRLEEKWQVQARDDHERCMFLSQSVVEIRILLENAQIKAKDFDSVSRRLKIVSGAMADFARECVYLQNLCTVHGVPYHSTLNEERTMLLKTEAYANDDGRLR